MFGFRNRKPVEPSPASLTEDDIVRKIDSLIHSILDHNPCGQRDYSPLLELGSEYTDTDIFQTIMQCLAIPTRDFAEESYLCADVTDSFLALRDLKTIPGFEEMGKRYCTHENFFMDDYQRMRSIIPTKNCNLDQYFIELKKSIGIYDKLVMQIIHGPVQNGLINFQNKKNLDDVSKESILSDLLLTDISESELVESKKILISYALNGDLPDAVDQYFVILDTYYRKYFCHYQQENYIPSTDILISEAIFKAYGYCDFDLDANFNCFHSAYCDRPAYYDQFAILKKVYQYLGLTYYCERIETV